MSDPALFWQQKPRRHGADIDLGHLKPLDRSMAGHRTDTVPLRFRFSYHCCTDKPGRRDLGTRIRGGSFNPLPAVQTPHPHATATSV